MPPASTPPASSKNLFKTELAPRSRAISARTLTGLKKFLLAHGASRRLAHLTNLRLTDEAPEPNIVHQPQDHEYRNHVRAARTHERQRNSRHGHVAHYHSHVHQNVK